MDLRNALTKTFAAGAGALLLAHSALAPVLADTSLAPEASAPVTTYARTSGAGSRVEWQGGSWYLHGANVPWFNWACDFGCGSRENGGRGGGVSDPATRAEIEKGFALLKENGVKVARWWLFEGDAWQIERDSSGAPAGINPTVYADVDAALALAEKYDLYYEFTLFSGVDNVPSAWLHDAGQRAKLGEALGQLFARYKDHPRVLAYDVMNEPDWDIFKGKIAKEPVQATIKEIAAQVHAKSNAYVTVGSAMLDGLPMWKGLGLDFYEAHWYDYMNGGDWCARCTDYQSVQKRYDLDRPLVIGEFYAGNDVDALQRFNDFRAKGFAGAYAWSLFWDHTHDKMQLNYGAAKQFAGQSAETAIRGLAPTAQSAEATLEAAAG